MPETENISNDVSMSQFCDMVVAAGKLLTLLQAADDPQTPPVTSDLAD